jgi:quinol monooxygenase YgiN
MELDNKLLPGSLFHAAGQYGDGVRVIDVWEDQAAFEQFRDEKIGPITGAHGLNPPQVRTFTTGEDVRRGDSAPIGYGQVLTLSGVDHDRFVEIDRQVTGEDRPAPDGCIFHANGAVGEDYCIVDFWTDKETHDAFIASNVMPVMQAEGIAGPPVMEEMAIHNTMTEHATQNA